MRMRRRHWIVLIVLSLAVFVGGWLIVGIQKVRHTSSRLVCVCHVKCLVLALHNFHDTYRGFPTATVPHPSLPSEQRLSWIVVVLPYVEQDAVFKQFDLTCSASDPKNQAAVSHRFQHLVCGTSGEYDRHERTWKSPTPLTHFVGISGVGEDAVELPREHPRAGVFGSDRQTVMDKHILDGTSSTLMIVETAYNPGHWAYGGAATVRSIEPGKAPYLGEGRPFGGFHNGTWNWGMTRTGTCNAGMADGSTRSFTVNVASQVLEALATIAGKEPLPEDW
jgi:hypothetical protein